MSNPSEKPNLKLAVPFFMVTNMDQSLKFYSNGLGFEKKRTGNLKAELNGVTWNVKVSD